MKKAKKGTRRRDAFFTQWAAQFFVGAELTRRGYIVGFTLGNARATDMLVLSPSGQSFPVEVKGLARPNYWLVKKPDRKSARIYVFALIPQEKLTEPPQFFVMTAGDLARIHVDDEKWPGMGWGKVRKFQNLWTRLPR
jgi:hypothetical protein